MKSLWAAKFPVLGVLAVVVSAPSPAQASSFRREKQLLAPTGDVTFSFGAAVAIDANTAVIGAQGGDVGGAAYVYVRSGSTWTLQQRLTPPEGGVYSGFGLSVAISGELIVVGAFNADAGTTLKTGAAYVFSRLGSTWTEQAKLTAADGVAADWFGLSVAIAGETILVGAMGDDTAAGADAGSAYVFVPGMFFGSWTQQQKLTAPDGAAQDRFGGSVALSGETAIVGARSDGTSAGTEAGSAYVFTRSGTTWAQQQKLEASDGSDGDLFGYAVALTGDSAVIGAPSDNTSFFDTGSAYVFTRSGTAWTQQRKLTASDPGDGDEFGNVVAFSGDTVVVGAWRDETAGGETAGSAYVFVRSAGDWTQLQRLAASDGAAGDRFGYAVAISGDTAVVGAAIDTTPAGAGKGSAHVFRLFAKGDLDRDGQTDLLVRLGSTGQTDVWLMNGITRPQAPVTLSPMPTSLDWSVAGTDDFNADRGNDLLLWNKVSGAAEFWFMNGTTRIGTTQLISAPPPPWRLSATADFNRDGRPDIVFRNSTTQLIAIWAMNGANFVSELSPSPDHAVDANWEIVGAQDWNGDGDTDFLWYNPNSGKIVLWFMDANLVRLAGQFTNPANAGDSNWKVLAMGDYGLGPAGLPGTVDLVWRNTTSGRFVVWYMDQAGNRTSGTFTTPMEPSPNPTGWTIVGPR